MNLMQQGHVPGTQESSRSLRAVLRRHIDSVLRQSDYDLMQAARVLDIPLDTLLNYVRMFNIAVPR
jgi:transcriptional regulator with GAF, ATPase, and Fis domain